MVFGIFKSKKKKGRRNKDLPSGIIPLQQYETQEQAYQPSFGRQTRTGSFETIPENGGTTFHRTESQLSNTSATRGYTIRSSYNAMQGQGFGRPEPPRAPTRSTFLGYVVPRTLSTQRMRKIGSRISMRGSTQRQPFGQNPAANNSGNMNNNSGYNFRESNQSNRISFSRSVRQSVGRMLRRPPPPRPTSRGVPYNFEPTPPKANHGIHSQTIEELLDACSTLTRKAEEGVTAYDLENLDQAIEIAKVRGVHPKCKEMKDAIALEKHMRAQFIAQKAIEKAMKQQDFKMLAKALKRAKKAGVDIEIKFSKTDDESRYRSSMRRSYMKSLHVPFTAGR